MGILGGDDIGVCADFEAAAVNEAPLPHASKLRPFGMIFGYQITWGNEHDRHEFYQFSHLAYHQRGSICNLALSLQILRNAWTLVILFRRLSWGGLVLGSAHQSLGIGPVEYPASTTRMFGTSRRSWVRWR